MRIPYKYTLLSTLVGIVIIIVIGSVIISPPLPLIVSAGFDRDVMTPNADGDNDIATFSYTLSRTGMMDMVLIGEDGTEFYFREQQPRSDDDYSVLFSGVVDGYILDDEEIHGAVERRLIPNGQYTWQLTVVTDSGETMTETGALVVEDGDSPLPLMSIFTISPSTFAPNQDGIDDRVEINVYLEKDVDSLDVFLLGLNDVHIPISARVEERDYGEAGRHRYDYEGGIDLGADPPPDGTYTVVALAQDAVGQRIRQEAELTIEIGGKPYAEIAPQAVGVDVVFDVQPYLDDMLTTREQAGKLVTLPDDPEALAYSQQITIPLGDMLVFMLTVENYGDVPIRTTGPAPGTVYQQEQQAATLGWFDESGAWRVGIQCATSQTSYPYRWAVGDAEDLVEVYDEATGNTYQYLPAGQRVIVWGAIRLNEIEARNPQNCWAGLIHEDVEVSIRNNNVGARSILIVDPKAESEE
jgi:hypothetical protein